MSVFGFADYKMFVKNLKIKNGGNKIADEYCHF